MSPPYRIRRYLTVFAAVGLLVPVLLVWSVEYPPQVDTPNHLARHYLEALTLRGDPPPPGYAVEYRVLPNLGADFVIPVLMQVFGPVAAAKVFLSLAVVLFWGGPAWFILQTGRYRTPALVAALLFLPFVLNGAFFFGFLNYYSGLALAFLALVHLGTLTREGPPRPLGLLGHAGLVALLFFWHLAAATVYGLLAGCLILARARDWVREGRPVREVVGRTAAFGLPLVPVVVLFTVYTVNKTVTPPPSVWGDPVRKVERVAAQFRGYSVPADLLAGACWAAAVVAFYGRALLTAPRGWVGLGAAVLAAAYLILPFKWGSTSDADSRLLPALMVCVLAWLGSLPLRGVRLGLILLAAGCLIRAGSVGYAWHQLDDRLRGAARSFEVIREGGRVLPVILVPRPAKDHPEHHFVCLAVIARGADVPTLFAFPDQQPLRRTGAAAPPGEWRDGVFSLADEAVRGEFDYLWVYNPDGVELRLPAHWPRVFAGGHVGVWEIPEVRW